MTSTTTCHDDKVTPQHDDDKVQPTQLVSKLNKAPIRLNQNENPNLVSCFGLHVLYTPTTGDDGYACVIAKEVNDKVLKLTESTIGRILQNPMTIDENFFTRKADKPQLAFLQKNGVISIHTTHCYLVPIECVNFLSQHHVKKSCLSKNDAMEMVTQLKSYVAKWRSKLEDNPLRIQFKHPIQTLEKQTSNDRFAHSANDWSPTFRTSMDGLKAYWTSPQGHSKRLGKDRQLELEAWSLRISNIGMFMGYAQKVRKLQPILQLYN